MAEKILQFKQPLSDWQKHQVHLAKTAIEALLEINGGSARVLMYCLHEERIRDELEQEYTRTGWYVEFLLCAINTDPQLYFIDVLKVKPRQSTGAK